MTKVTEILRMNRIKKNDLAMKLHVSRPTLDLYISKYEKGEKIENDFYDNLFHVFFDEDKTEEELKQLIGEVPSIKTKVIVYETKLKNNIEYYGLKRMISNIREELNRLEQSLDLVYKG